jgi:4-amino-4-deoxy-L-arabinose transferase-like glycosyltransferase
LKELTNPISTKALTISLSVLSLLIYLVIFLKIDTYQIRWWDESMFAVNTYEMLHNGKYFSLYFNGAPDLINTKPPLTVWCQLFFVKFLGFNEIAVRLPSVIASASCVFILFLFTLKRFGLLMAWLSALILLTSHGYTGYHTGRTADSDALLTLFTLLANIFFLRFIWEQKNSLIGYFFIFLTLAFLTKMYAAILFAPAYLIILLRHQLLKKFTLNWNFFIGFVGTISISIGVLILREHDTPGYLKEILFKDAGRIFKVVEDHKHTWEYYLDNFIFTRYSFWFVPMILSIYFIVLNRSKKEENFFIDVIFIIVSYLVIISSSVTKLLWYDMPLYPYMAMVTSFGIFKILQNEFNFQIINAKTIVALLVIFSYPYWIMFRKSQANMIPNGEKKNEASERFLFLKSVGKSNLDGIKIYYYGWSGSLMFYKYKFAEKGENLELTTSPDFKPTDRVLIAHDSLYAVVQSKYKFKLLEKESNARLIQIE